jgi:hypothetical protein
MPAVNPRITITLEPSIHALLRRLSAVSKDSQSSIVSGILAQSAPVLERVIAVLEAAQAASEHLKTEAATSLVAAHSQIERQLGLALEAMDEGVKPLLDEAEKVRRRTAGPTKRRSRARGSDGLPTPMSNRGVTPSSINKKTTEKKTQVRGKQ